ncbi:MAG: alpha/beta hydrolase [Pseudomonadales bacterium]|nr:alpha/beta hydrolase [Pseudomonadales bacterium]MCP5185072.1 alpha/beta hydrolase [Pseudomonadales bacterium]
MDTPFWYQRAIDTPSGIDWVTVDGAAIRYATWGEVGRPGVVLIHGSNAHLEWWRFTAPYLADAFRVTALDLSGNGDSDWREKYSGELFAREVWAVCQAAGLGDRPTVVGHSFGGFVALEAAHRYGEHLAGVVFMDFTVAPPEQYLEWGLRAQREGVQPRRKLRTYATREEILARFRFIPEQPDVHPAVLRHMAEAGIKAVDGGYTWKFDPALFDFLEMGVEQRDKFASLACRSFLMLGEKSTDEGALFGDHMATITGGHLPALTVPGTYHHLMFDQPLAVAMALKAVLLQWQAEDNRPHMQRELDKLLEKRHG